jgi:hypothetical protein
MLFIQPIFTKILSAIYIIFFSFYFIFPLTSHLRCTNSHHLAGRLPSLSLASTNSHHLHHWAPPPSLSSITGHHYHHRLRPRSVLSFALFSGALSSFQQRGSGAIDMDLIQTLTMVMWWRRRLRMVRRQSTLLCNWFSGEDGDDTGRESVRH